MFSQTERSEPRNVIRLELGQVVIRPRAHDLRGPGNERAGGQHQGGIRSEIRRHFDSFPAWAHPDRSALAIRRQQDHRSGKNVRQQVAQPFRVALR